MSSSVSQVAFIPRKEYSFKTFLEGFAWARTTTGGVVEQVLFPLLQSARRVLKRKVRLFVLSPENKLRELCYDHGTSNDWFEGSLIDAAIEVAPYSQVAAVYLPDNKIRVVRPEAQRHYPGVYR
ncbi:hypothetical protein ACEPPN_007573 [Leptodophora sp. 'Broadleaf-Isolate-01']